MAQGEQDRALYSGVFSIGEFWQGSAEYQYSIHRRDTIFDGPFKFESSRRMPDDKSILTGISYAGKYAKGEKDGSWLFSLKQFEVSENFYIKGNLLVKEANGFEYLVEGKFKNGLADGRWTANKFLVANSNIVDTVFHAQGIAKNGVLTDKFTAYKKDIALSAKFNDTGKPSGEWKLLHKGPNGMVLEEFRFFQNGKLTEHYFRLNNRRVEVRHSGLTLDADDDENWEERPMDELYFKALEFSTIHQNEFRTPFHDSTHASTPEIMGKSNQAIENFMHSFSRYDSLDIWTKLPGASSVTKPVILLKKFPMSRADERKRKEVGELYMEATTMVEIFLSNLLLEVSQHAHKEIARNVKVMEILQDRLQKLTPCVDRVTDDALLYVDRDQLIPHITPIITYPSSIDFELKGKPFSTVFDFPSPLLPENGSLHSIHHHTERILQIARELSEETSDILERYQLEGELTEREERLVEKRDSVLALYRNEAGREDFNRFHERISEAVTSLAKEEFKRYARLDIDQKIDQIKAVQNCYREAIEAYEMIERIPLRIERLEEIYTRSVWNAYTFTYMDERIKDRLYRVYENTLLPLVIDDMVANVECGKLKVKQQNMVNLYQRMVELRDQDTREMERQLRRVSDPEEIMQILSLNLNLN